MRELLGGNVHAHGKRWLGRKLSVPRCHLFAGFTQQQSVHRDNQSGLVGYRDKLGGREQTISVLPSGQGLETGDPARLQGNNWLVVSSEFPQFQTLAKLRLQ